MTHLELIASLLGVLCVWLVVRRNILTFPIGLIQVTLTAVVCWQARLYSDMLLQGVFAAMQIQGWLIWSHSDRADDDRIAVRTLVPVQWVWTGALLLAGTYGLGYAMATWTPASFPYRDAFCAVQSVLAQWWMNKRYLENWILWIAVDQVYIFLYLDKQLYYFAALSGVFLVQAVMGYAAWRRKVVVAAG